MDDCARVTYDSFWSLQLRTEAQEEVTKIPLSSAAASAEEGETDRPSVVSPTVDRPACETIRMECVQCSQGEEGGDQKDPANVKDCVLCL